MRELPDRPSMEHYRREAKALVRAYREGDADVLERAERVLGDRGRFLLSDAQFVLACEHGFASWAAFRTAIEASPLDELAKLERGEIVVDSGLAYGDGERVEILVRKRLHRYDLDDRGRAVEKAGRRPGWHEIAQRAGEPMNVARNGEVCVFATAGRDIASLLVRLADASRRVHEALLDLEG